MGSSPPFVYNLFPISQITPSTIVLGSAGFAKSTTSTDVPTDLDYNQSSSKNITAPSLSSHNITPPLSPKSSVLSSTVKSESLLPSIITTNMSQSNEKDTLSTSPISSPTIMNTILGPAIQNSPSTIAIPFSDKQIEASAVLITSSDPPERCTSPRRDNVAIEKIGREKVQVLRKEAELIQESLTDILERIIKVKEDYDRLTNENRFLQDYIGNLMSTSNILNKTNHA